MECKPSLTNSEDKWIPRQSANTAWRSVLPYPQFTGVTEQAVSDGSSYGKGTYFEGCITTGVATNETDELIQANIVAAGYGK